MAGARFERTTSHSGGGQTLAAWGWVGLAALVVLALALLAFKSASLPLQLWDESRNANNALEMARHGHWLTPTYNGVVDFWNTKPPLLIWCMAALMKLGAAPLWAVRIPSLLAALATLGVMWSVLGYGLGDMAAANIAGALLLSSRLYVGVHAARTGDYDALESLFILGYVIAFWAAFSGPRARPNWLFATALCIFGAVMTKGVAGGLATPGLIVFAASRPRRLAALLADVRTWAAVALTAILCAGYYLSRQAYNPGYVQAVLANEIGGRFSTVSEAHTGGLLYYVRVLGRKFEPGLLCLPLGLLALLDLGRRRELAWVTGLCGLALLAILSVAKTKLEWYATPIVPLFSIAAAIGLADGLRWIADRRPDFARWGGVALTAILVLACASTLRYNLALARREDGAASTMPQVWYGRFLSRLKAVGTPAPVTAVDSGLPNSAGFANYDPLLQFYARELGQQGWLVSVQPPGEPIASGTRVVTCDPVSLAWLNRSYLGVTDVRDATCTLMRVSGRR